jgi:hypothetical protein
MDDSGSSVFYATAAAVLGGQDPMYDKSLKDLPPNYKSRFKAEVNSFVKKFTTALEDGDPQAFAMM